MKKLNRKGFTLIELLAVIVILAVVMGIAVNSVLSSMNKARAGAIADTAMIVANAFNQKYTEELVGGTPEKVYMTEMGETNGYNFAVTDTTKYTLSKKLVSTLKISDKTYALVDGYASITTLPTVSDGGKTIDASFLEFNPTTGVFTVCMSAMVSGPNYVAAYSKANGSGADSMKGFALNDATMMACSDGVDTWTVQ